MWRGGADRDFLREVDESKNYGAQMRMIAGQLVRADLPAVFQHGHHLIEQAVQKRLILRRRRVGRGHRMA